MEFSRLATSWVSLGLVLVSTVSTYVVVVVYTCGRRPELGDDVQLRRRGDGRARLDRRNRRHLGTPLLHGTTSLAVLYAAQLLGASLRRRGRIGSTLDNDPLLVFIDGDVPEVAFGPATSSRPRSGRRCAEPGSPPSPATTLSSPRPPASSRCSTAPPARPSTSGSMLRGVRPLGDWSPRGPTG